MKRFCPNGLLFALFGLMTPRTVVADQMICIGAADYISLVPDTLDLAERAEMGLNHFLGLIDETRGYEMNETFWFRYAVPVLGFTTNSLGACQCKALEAMCFQRLMTGSRQGLEREAKMIEMMASLLGDDGLMWVPGKQDKPWIPIPEPYAMVHGQGRMLRAMIAWYQYTGDPEWKKRIDRMVGGINKIVVHKDDYAYFPVYGWYEQEYLRSCYTKRGWKDPVEPTDERFGEEGSLFNHQGHVAGALATWYALTGNQDALRLSAEFVRFLTKPKFWADFKDGPAADHAHWWGHACGHPNTLRAILDYAVAANDPRLKLFVRDGYEWSRQSGLSRIGIIQGMSDWQGCIQGRLIGLAVKLTESGAGDYWEDVDLYVRNIGVEMQVGPEDVDYLRGFSKGKPEPPVGPEYVPDDKAAEKAVGGYFALRGETPFVWLCCSTHGNMGLFYAWDAALRYSAETAKVNLLLNRASPWMDVDSYLPYEGRVVLHNKSAREAFVRIPLYANLATVKCRVGDRTVAPEWFNRFLRIGGLKRGDHVEITFPLEVHTERWSYASKTFTIKLKANTVIAIDPSLGTVHESAGHVMFTDLDRYNRSEVPMKKVTRSVSSQILRW